MLLAVFSKEILLLSNKIANLNILHDIANQAVYIGCIAIGCIGALVSFKYSDLTIKIIHSRITQSVSMILFIAALILISIYKDVTIIDYRYYAIIFSIIIINAATNSGSLYNLNNKCLDYLGKISYGLYMYHEFGIGCSIAIIKYFSNYFHSRIALDIALYSGSLSVTVLISALSFKYFEGFFLKFKSRLS